MWISISFSYQGQLKLADFGLSLHTFSRKNSIAGTIEYLAPEMGM